MSVAVLSPLGGPLCSGAFDSHEDETMMEPPLLLFDQSVILKDVEDGLDDSIPDLAAEENHADIDMEDESDVSEAASQSFGGLNNLGNTCYQGSALQMLASLDHFVPSLAAASPPRSAENGGNDESRDGLRMAFLDLMQSLREERSTSVSPNAFKKAMDERSSLFVGYRQQDSHEFLTTLLDLLDKDYDDPKESGDEIMDGTDNVEASESDLTEKAEVLERTVEETSPIEEEMEHTSVPPPASPLRRLRSFTQLGNDDISQLLHGNKKPKQDGTSTTDSPKQPLCKLVGGRAIVPSSSLSPFSLLDAVTAEAVAKIPPETTSDDEVAELEDEREPSPVDEYFATHVRARLTCDSCLYTRSHMEKFLHLSLDIGTESGSVEDGLRKFFSPEIRQIKCEKCFCETATQTMEIVKLPRAMLLHFKRFIVEVSPDFTSVVYRKNQSPVHFGNNLPVSDRGVLGEFLAADVDIPRRVDVERVGQDDPMEDDDVREYRIRSVVNHIGSSASCGHYTADAERLYPNGEREWTRFNDSYVSKVTKQEAVGESARRTAYMVLCELE